MLVDSLLYPVTNETRTAISLDGLWEFEFDPEKIGNKEDWPSKGLPDPISMPVPASFSDFFTDKKDRDFVGDIWYEKRFFIPADWKNHIFVRFGSLTHTCSVYCNGKEVAQHVGGFLPVIADITDAAKVGEENLLVVRINNALSEVNIPCGTTKILPDGREIAQPYFDFFNYSGIHRSVYLVNLPSVYITDYDLVYELEGDDAIIDYKVYTSEDKYDISVKLVDEEGQTVAEGDGREGKLTVKNPHLWQVGNAYLYKFVMDLKDGDKLIDTYTGDIGIRTVKIEGTKILINGEPVYLKGYGKHEDADIIGRGFNYGIAKRDFELMKWNGANTFRTSHYPYAEEWYQMADQEGFLIIDEVPAVGMFRSTMNFLDATTGTQSSFFESETVPELQKNHIAQIEEMIVRDKNHPSVIAWSLFNEPETNTEEARDYFTEVFEATKEYDPQQRPRTGAFIMNSTPDKDLVHPLVDIVALNRYYGWYVNGGSEIDEAEVLFRKEMDGWKEKDLNKPFIFTEFGADTLAEEHKLPSVMWSQEYQDEYMNRNFDVMDDYDFVQGELVWNFADFQTTEGILRANGNKKGVFTRQRQPKQVAYLLKDRWENFEKE